MSVHVLPTAAIPDLPFVSPGLRLPSPRRPGELLEAVRLDAMSSDELRRAAALSGLSADLCATILIEWFLACEWLDAVGMSASGLSPDEEWLVALQAAEADYLRALTVGRRLGHRVRERDPSRPTTVSIPVRLVARCTPRVCASAMSGDVEAAVAWEVAALRNGQQLGECVARSAAATLWLRSSEASN